VKVLRTKCAVAGRSATFHRQRKDEEGGGDDLFRRSPEAGPRSRLPQGSICFSPMA